MKGLLATIELLDEGGTVPFIARYRKESTGNLDEVQIRAIEEKLALFPRTGRPQRDHPRLHSGTGQAHRRLEGPHRADARQERARRPLPALQAQAPHQGHHRPRKGLEPLADYLWDQEPTGDAARNICRVFCRCRKRRRHRGRSARRRAPHRRRNDQRGRRHPQAAAPGHVRGRRHRQQESRRTRSTNSRSSRCITTTASR